MAQVISAPVAAVERGLSRRSVWANGFRAVSLRPTAAAPAETELSAGERADFRDPRRRRRATLEVTGTTATPEVRLRFGRVQARGRFQVAATRAGVLVTFDLLVAAPVLQGGRARRLLIRFGENLLEAAAVDAAAARVVVAGAVLRDGRVLAARRTRPPELAGKWEMPGGKVEPDESEPAALVRELGEELGLQVVVGERIGPACWVGENLVLHAYLADWVAGEPEPQESVPAHDEVRWLGPEELAEVDWLPGDEPFVAAVSRWFSGDRGADLPPARR